jgi:hypothetical protein
MPVISAINVNVNIVNGIGHLSYGIKYSVRHNSKTLGNECACSSQLAIFEERFPGEEIGITFSKLTN